jgi:hypothetical protein
MRTLHPIHRVWPLASCVCVRQCRYASSLVPHVMLSPRVIWPALLTTTGPRLVHLLIPICNISRCAHTHARVHYFAHTRLAVLSSKMCCPDIRLNVVDKHELCCRRKHVHVCRSDCFTIAFACFESCSSDEMCPHYENHSQCARTTYSSRAACCVCEHD